MALGGGTWLTQNKVLPGTYINFTSIARATATLSDRGVAAAPFILNWGPEGTVFEVTSGDFQKNSKTIFGYSYDAPEMLALREIFCHATKVYCYRLGTNGVKASNTYGSAKYAGTRGNDINIAIARNVDNTELYDVSTYIDGIIFETQTVSDASELVGNAFVDFKTDAVLAETVGVPMSGGSNSSLINGEAHQAFLDKIESYSYNTLCCPSADETTVTLYEKFCVRVRDNIGAKAQLVAWKSDADHEGVIGVWNTVTHASISDIDEHMLVYWAAGAQAGATVNESLTNAKYDGELRVNTDYTQAELEAAVKAGKFMLHNVNGEVRVLEDINTLVTVTSDKGDIFKSNQTIRIADLIANDTTALFGTRYAGIVPNDESGRVALWNDIVKYMQELERIRAIENFDPDTVSVEQGDTKKAVLLIINGLNVVNAMSQLYMGVMMH